MSDEKTCESCGMPMRESAEFGGGRTDNSYCVHCTDAEGNLKSYDQALEGMAQFMVRTNGLAEAEARKAAKEYMAGMPAWKAHQG